MDAISKSKYAEDTGADAVIVHTPYFWLPSREGIYEHFKAVKAAIDIPLFLFDNPHRAGIDMDCRLISELSKIEGTVGIKDAVHDITKFLEVIQATRHDFSVFSAYDTMILPVLALGGKGVFSVAANVAPDLLLDCFNSFKEGDLKRTRKLQFDILPIAKILYKYYPASVKVALRMQGMPFTGIVRMPVLGMSKEEEDDLKKVLTNCSLL